MCDNHDASDVGAISERKLSRRDFGRLSAVVASTAALTKLWTSSAARAATLPPSVDSLQGISMAMHQHASFSEQDGSMDGALAQAVATGVNTVWWTEHDARMNQMDGEQQVHFTSFSEKVYANRVWNWTVTRLGPVSTTSRGAIVQSPASPNDPVAGGSLLVNCLSTGQQAATFGYFADSHPAGWNYQGNIYGQQLTFEALPQSIGPKAYLEFQITSSWHPATGGRPAGNHVLSYRLGGPGTPGSRQATGLLGIINVPVVAGQWNTVTISPSDDIAALWPDVHPGDFALWRFHLNAVSLGTRAVGYFDYLRFSRPYASGHLPMELQKQLEDHYAAKYPGVAQRQGLEVSKFLPHVNWFGGGVTLNDPGGTLAGAPYEGWLTGILDQAHASGGLVSYNHPFGYSSGADLPVAQQDAQLASVAARLLANNLLGCDILEVGYVSRAQVDLAHHVGLWDVLSRNGRFVTGNGVTDDHVGRNWSGARNNWTTTAWAASNAEGDLLGALGSGRVFTSSLTGFHGSLDLWADGVCPMGSVSISQVPSRDIQVNAVSVPVGGSVEVVQGAVDYGGAAPNSAVVNQLSADSLVSGTATVPVDTSLSSFVRLQVRAAGGAVVALSNPVWLLRETPPSGIPSRRAA